VSGAVGQVRLAAVAVAEPLVAQALALLSTDSPDLELELAVGGIDVYADLEAGRCDLVVGDEINAARSRSSSALRITSLRTEPLVMLYRQSHPLAVTPDATMTETLAYPWAIPSRYFSENRALQELAEYAQAPGFPRYRLSSVAACIQLVAASDVIGLVPQTAALDARALGLMTADLAQPLTVPLATVTLARAAPGPSVMRVQQVLRAAAEAIAQPV
ncbi:MAG: LysR substrate-binding domain-containing protein, partial [Pseudomonadales bacterium]